MLPASSSVEPSQRASADPLISPASERALLQHSVARRQMQRFSGPESLLASPLAKKQSSKTFFDILQPLRHLLRQEPSQDATLPELGKGSKKPTNGQQRKNEESKPHHFLRSLFHIHPSTAKKRHILVSNYILDSHDESVLAKELHVSMSELDEMIKPMQHLLKREFRQGMHRRHHLAGSDVVSDVSDDFYRQCSCHGFGEGGLEKEDLLSGHAVEDDGHHLPENLSDSIDDDFVVLPHLNVGNVCDKYGSCFKEIGRGTGGIVRLLQRESDRKIFAVKEFRSRRKQETVKHYAECLTREYCIGSILHHPNIIKTIDMIMDHGKFYEVMEYCPTDLFQYIKTGKYGMAEAQCCFRQLIEGVAYLHSLQAAHMDLKPENVCLGEDGRLKIIDFGLSCVFRDDRGRKFKTAKGVRGSAPYISPEEWVDEEYDPQKVDVWAVGIIFLTLLYRAFPWEAAVATDVNFAYYLKVRSQRRVFRLFEKLERPFVELMECILEPKPSIRCTSQQILLSQCVQAIRMCDPHPLSPDSTSATHHQHFP